MSSKSLKTEIQDTDILIGQDNSEALVPLQVVQGNKGEPFGVKTILGWSLHGKLDKGATSSLTCGLITSTCFVDVTSLTSSALNPLKHKTSCCIDLILSHSPRPVWRVSHATGRGE